MGIKVMLTALALIIVLTLIASHFGLAGTYSENIGAELEEPGIWDVLTFSGSTFFALMAFQVDGMPYVFSIALWFLTFVVLAATLYLIRGTS